MSWATGNYSGGIARVGTRGCGRRRRQRQGDGGKVKGGVLSEPHQRRAEPEGRLAHGKRRLLADPRYARSRTLWLLSMAPEGLGPETRETELRERGQARGPGSHHSKADSCLLPDFCFLPSAAQTPTPSQDGAKDQRRSDRGLFLANRRGPDE